MRRTIILRVGKAPEVVDLDADNGTQERSPYKVAEGILSTFTERVTTPINGVHMFVDEIGTWKDLPLNLNASVFYPNGIVGDAVLFYMKEVYDSDGDPDLAIDDFPDLLLKQIIWILES